MGFHQLVALRAKGSLFGGQLSQFGAQLLFGFATLGLGILETFHFGFLTGQIGLATFQVGACLIQIGRNLLDIVLILAALFAALVELNGQRGEFLTGTFEFLGSLVVALVAILKRGDLGTEALDLLVEVSNLVLVTGNLAIERFHLVLITLLNVGAVSIVVFG